MDKIIIILLSLIVFLLLKVYIQQKNKIKIIAKEIIAKQKKESEKRFENYPYLYGKIKTSWLEIFASYSERNLSLLKWAYMLGLQQSVKIHPPEKRRNWENLYLLTEELLEHLEKYHKGSIVEHEIAVCTYLQISAEALQDILDKNQKIKENTFNAEPYTDITKIMSFFPKKVNHPTKEILFLDANGLFPRKSKGSAIISDKIMKQRL